MGKSEIDRSTVMKRLFWAVTPAVFDSGVMERGGGKAIS
jgi:hypothetical protein